MPLIVLDRDGVINEDSEDYVRSLADWRPIPGSLEAIASLSKAGYTIAVATNQSGLGRGYLDPDALAAIHARLYRQVEEEGGSIAGIFCCPHLPEAGCACRKPGTGLLAAIEAKLALSPRGAPLIGDSLRDLQAALAYGCRPVLVRTGKGAATLRELQSGRVTLAGWEDIPVYDDLAAAARAILQQRPAPKDDG